MALSGQALGRCSMTQVFRATTRAASFTRRSRTVSNCATRQVERFGIRLSALADLEGRIAALAGPP